MTSRCRRRCTPPSCAVRCGAHASVAINAAAAERHPGVAVVYTCGISGLRSRHAAAHPPSLDEASSRTQRPLARGDVCYVGQCVAMVAAVDRYVAEALQALIEVD